MEIEQWALAQAFSRSKNRGKNTPEIKVSNLGNVLRNGLQFVPCISRAGYRVIRLNGRVEKLHRVICAAFNGQCPPGMQCCHNDGNPLNNAAMNLRWDTYSGNQMDRVAHGTDNRGEKCGTAKLKSHDVIEIRRLVADGVGHKELSSRFGVHCGAISKIALGKRWKHV